MTDDMIFGIIFGLVGGSIFTIILIVILVYNINIPYEVILKINKRKILKYFDLLDDIDQNNLKELEKEDENTDYYFNQIENYVDKIDTKLKLIKIGSSSFHAQINEKIKVNQRIKELKKELNHD